MFAFAGVTAPAANAAGRLTSGQVNTKLERACQAFERTPVPDTDASAARKRKTVVAFGKAVTAHDQIAKTIVPIDVVEQGAIRTLRGFTNSLTREIATISRLLAKPSTQQEGLDRFDTISDRFTDRGIGVRLALEENNLFVCRQLLPNAARADAQAPDTATDPVASTAPVNPSSGDPIPVTTIPINPFAIADPAGPITVPTGGPTGGPTTAAPTGVNTDVTADDLALEPFFPTVSGLTYVRSAALDSAVAGVKKATGDVYSAGLGKQVQDNSTGAVRLTVLVYRFRNPLSATVLDQVVKQSAKFFDGTEGAGVAGFRVVRATFAGQDKIFAIRPDVAIEVTGLPTTGKGFITDFASTLLTQAPAPLT